MPRNNNRRAKRNDQYLGKVADWNGHLTDTLNGKGRYDLDRCLSSLNHFTAKAMEARAEKSDDLGAWMDANISFGS